MSQSHLPAAGSFSEWIQQFLEHQQNHRDQDVPCGECTACCQAHFFIHVEADEDQTLKAIPPELLFDAPGSDGVKLMGHDKKGNCPLFQEGCSIYKFRPRTCRNFDCRVYGATGITPEFTSSALLDQIQAWKFTTQTELDHTLQKAVFDAVDFLNLHESTLPDDLKPYSSMRLAFLAVCMHTLFLKNVKEDPASMILRMKEEMKRLRML